MEKRWGEIDKQVKAGLVVDTRLNNFLKPVFPDINERRNFIKMCLKKTKTRRMLLRAQWYTEIADDQEKVRNNRPALKIIFLMGLAEAVTKTRVGKNNIEPLKAIQDFFRYILPEDKKMLAQNFQRAFLSPKHHSLRFTSIIRILYEIRNRAVHGEDYYSFALFHESEKQKYKDYTDFGYMTSGKLGKRKRKRRVPLSVKLTYEELRDAVRRTAIENIKKASGARASR
jgi:hypothetical protein